jgi:hypothetical protein
MSWWLRNVNTVQTTAASWMEEQYTFLPKQYGAKQPAQSKVRGEQKAGGCTAPMLQISTNHVAQAGAAFDGTQALWPRWTDADHEQRVQTAAYQSHDAFVAIWQTPAKENRTTTTGARDETAKEKPRKHDYNTDSIDVGVAGIQPRVNILNGNVHDERNANGQQQRQNSSGCKHSIHHNRVHVRHGVPAGVRQS